MVVNKEERDPVQAVGQPPDPAVMSNHLPILNPTRPELTRITLTNRHEPDTAFDTVMARPAGRGVGA